MVVGNSKNNLYVINNLIKGKFVMKFVRIIWILLISSTLVNCASRSQVGAVLGGASATVSCVELHCISNPYLSATCAL